MQKHLFRIGVFVLLFVTLCACAGMAEPSQVGRLQSDVTDGVTWVLYSDGTITVDGNAVPDNWMTGVTLLQTNVGSTAKKSGAWK